MLLTRCSLLRKSLWAVACVAVDSVSQNGAFLFSFPWLVNSVTESFLEGSANVHSQKHEFMAASRPLFTKHMLHICARHRCVRLLQCTRHLRHAMHNAQLPPPYSPIEINCHFKCRSLLL